MRGAFVVTLVALAIVGCNSNKAKKQEPVVAAPITPQPAGPVAPGAEMPKDATHAAVMAQTKAPGAQAPAPAPTGDGLTGKVLERLDASPYCYLRLKTAKGEVWAAVPEAKVEKGADVTVLSPMLMPNFESKTLKRTFAEVYFGTLAPTGAAASPAANPHAGMPQQPSAPVKVGKVEKATGADARTVAEIWGQQAGLKDKTVTVRGTVVKYSAGIMGKNWLHLQDGSGDAAKATHDLTVTSLDTAAKGDIVTVKGTVRLNKDFGSGYSYAVLVEDAKVTKK
jgi:hypothetical protein